MDKIYLNGQYFAANPTYHKEDAEWKSNEIISLIMKNNLSPTSILDIGCGTGEILSLLKKKISDSKMWVAQGYRSDESERIKYFGFDISPEAVEIAKLKEEESNIRFFCDDITKSEGIYTDLLLSIDVFEHIENYLEFLKNIKNRADFKIFHIPLDMTVHMVLRNSPIIYSRQKYGHLHYFSKDTALLTLRDTGYEIMDWKYTPTMFMNDRKKATKLLNIIRRFVFRFNADIPVRIFGDYSLLVLAK